MPGTRSGCASGEKWDSRRPCTSWIVEPEIVGTTLPRSESTLIWLPAEARAQADPCPSRVDPMNYETILVAHRGASALITLNRPDKLNAMSMMLKAELVRALQELDNRDETRAIVITGAGDKAFTAGGASYQVHSSTAHEHWGLS